jgi:hypothetical protein
MSYSRIARKEGSAVPRVSSGIKIDPHVWMERQRLESDLKAVIYRLYAQPVVDAMRHLDGDDTESDSWHERYMIQLAIDTPEDNPDGLAVIAVLCELARQGVLESKSPELYRLVKGRHPRPRGTVRGKYTY